jgi:hypothetical protein
MTDYYVDGAVGDNGNLGTSEGAGNAWATIDYALSQAVGGDTIYVKASASYPGFTSPAFGTNASPIRVIGYSSTINDGGQVTVDGGGGALGFFNSASNAYIMIYNIRVTGVSSNPGFSASSNIYYQNCQADNCQLGFSPGSSNNIILNCVAYNNTFEGFKIGQSGWIHGCIGYNNSRYGTIAQGANVTISNCLFYNNTNSDIWCGTVNGRLWIQNTTFDSGSVAECIDLGTNCGAHITDNIFHDCTTAIAAGYTGNWYMASAVIQNNLFSGVTNYVARASEYPWLEDDVIVGNPGFVDESNNDYTLTDISDALNIGTLPGLTSA